MLKMKEFDVMEGGGPFLVRLSSSWDLVTNMFVTNSLFDET
jgi:hypothetical protein